MNFKIDQSAISPMNLAELKIGECIKVNQSLTAHDTRESKEIVFEVMAKLLFKTILSNKPLFELQLIFD